MGIRRHVWGCGFRAQGLRYAVLSRVIGPGLLKAHLRAYLQHPTKLEATYLAAGSGLAPISTPRESWGLHGGAKCGSGRLGFRVQGLGLVLPQ